MMSWDSKAVGLIAIVWMMLGLLYGTVIGMIAGARAWWAGGVILLVVLGALLVAERRREPAVGEEQVSVDNDQVPPGPAGRR